MLIKRCHKQSTKGQTHFRKKIVFATWRDFDFLSSRNCSSRSSDRTAKTSSAAIGRMQHFCENCFGITLSGCVERRQRNRHFWNNCGLVRRGWYHRTLRERETMGINLVLYWLRNFYEWKERNARVYDFRARPQHFYDGNFQTRLKRNTLCWDETHFNCESSTSISHV